MSFASIERDWPGPDDDRPGLLVRTPYDEVFVDRLKADLPREGRRWCPDLTAWWVAEEHEEAVIALVCATFGGVMIFAEEGDELHTAVGERCTQERLF